MNSDKKRELIASGGLLLATIIWGFAFVVVKNSLDTIPPTYMVAIRFTIAFLGLSIVFAKKYASLTKRIVFEGLVLGFWLFLSYALQTVGCKYTTAGKNAFITTVYVVLVPLLYWAFSRKRPDVYEILSAIAAFLGIGILSLDEGGSVNIGDVLTLLCGFGFAMHMVFVCIYNKKRDPVILVILQSGFAALFAWFAAPAAEGSFVIGTIGADAWVGVLYLGLFSTMTAYLLQNVGQKYVAPSKAALIMSTEAVFGTLFSVIFLKEVITLRTAIGFAIIFCAVVTAETKLDFIKFKNIKTKGEVHGYEQNN